MSTDQLTYVLLFFIGASLLLYVVLGGADYGAGILELLPSPDPEKQKKIVNSAMGPVWEANHMWLIIVVVMLFMGFPKAFQNLVVSLHLPLVALLVGIVVRGSVFAFRHYDAMATPISQKTYTVLFGFSSLWTSLWLGIIAASLFRGGIDMQTVDPYRAYIAPWWGLFPLAMGIFVVCNFAYLAAIYLIDETREAGLQKFFSKRALQFNVLVILTGGLVFLAAHLENNSLAVDFFTNPYAVACMVSATVLFGILWGSAKRHNPLLTRVTAAGQTALILFGWFILQAPNVMITKSGPLSFFAAAAPAATLWQLVLALLIGSAFIFPSLFYLIRVFKLSR